MTTNAIALTRLLVCERPFLLRLVQRIVGNAPTAEDVTQSLWFKVQRIDDDPPIVNKRAYLYRLATNLACDFARADQRYRSVFESGELPEEAVAPLPSADAALIDRQNLDILMAALDELPERTRTVFILRKIHEMPVEEIAARFGVGRDMILKLLRAAVLHCDARLHDPRR